MPGNLYAKTIAVSDQITLNVPTVGEIIDNEEEYYQAVCAILATPYDMMVQLDDAHIDFTKINDFELFCLLFPRLKEMDTSLIFGELDLSGFQTVVNQNTNEIVLRDDDNDIVIDRVVHTKLCAALRDMLHIEKNDKRPGNDEAKAYLLKRARQQQKRKKHKKNSSMLESYIIALVNTEQFKYDYDTVRNITILQFYASLTQIVHKIHYDNTMSGYYAGTISGDDLTQADKSWIPID